MIKHIPNIITLGNLTCGCMAIVAVFEGQMALASYFVLAGALFDFFDGLAARMLGVTSPLGKDLDSLSDVVTFGVAPGCMMYYLLKLVSSATVVPYLAFAIPVFAAYRLAKFNNDPRQSNDFYGLPTPAAALFFISFPLMFTFDRSIANSFVFETQFLLICIGVVALLMVSDVRLFSLKIKRFSINEYRFPILFMVISNVLFFILFFKAIPLIIILYVVLSVIKNLVDTHEV